MTSAIAKTSKEDILANLRTKARLLVSINRTLSEQDTRDAELEAKFLVMIDSLDAQEKALRKEYDYMDCIYGINNKCYPYAVVTCMACAGMLDK